MPKIFINPGHGGSDSGATGIGLVEKIINLETSLQTKFDLQRHGFEVKMSRENDTYVSIEQASKMANDWAADLFVSEHENAFQGLGDRGEIIYCKGDSAGLRLANIISWYIKQLGQTKVNIYTREGDDGKPYYGVIRETNMTAIIVEPCFIDNVNDKTLVDTVEKQKAVGTAIAKSICEFYNITWVPQAPPETISDTTDTPTIPVTPEVPPIQVEEESLMSKLLDDLVTQYGEDNIKNAIIALINEQKKVDWKTQGNSYLSSKGYFSSIHDPNEIIDAGLLGAALSNYENHLRDKQAEDWTKSAVDKAKTLGIIKGDENGSLMLGSPVSREQLMVFFDRIGLLK